MTRTEKITTGVRSSRCRIRGFTLLEVMVAMTITGMAMGSLFGVIAGNKRLAWRAEESLVKTMQARSLINYSQLNDDLGEVYINFENEDLFIDSGYELAVPSRKTQATTGALRQYEVIDEFGELITSGTYWIELELPE